MKDFGIVKSSTRPPEIETTSNMVFLAADVTPYVETIDEHEIRGYKYKYVGYTKDEYIAFLGGENAALRTEILDTQSALCDVYELLEGGLE